MATNRYRLVSFPGADLLIKHFTDIKNKEALVAKLAYLMSGIWSYFYREKYSHYLEFESTFKAADQPIPLLESFIQFYDKDNEAGLEFLREIIQELFRADEKYVNQNQVIIDTSLTFIELTKKFIVNKKDEIRREELKKLTQEQKEKIQEEKDKQAIVERQKELQELRDTTCAQAKKLSITSFELERITTKHKEALAARVTDTDKISSTSLSNAKTAMTSFFGTKPSNPKFSLEKFKEKIDINKKLGAEKRKQKEEELKKQFVVKPKVTKESIFRHKQKTAAKKEAHQKALQAKVEEHFPYHRKPMM